MSEGKRSAWWVAAAFVLGALLGAAVVHKSATKSTQLLQTKLESAQSANDDLTAKLNAQEDAPAERPATKTAAVAADTLPTPPMIEPEDPDIAKAKRLVTQNLKDPTSAIFGAVKITEGAHGKLACGTINARNSFGGFTGMQRFTVDFDGASSGDSHAVSIGDAFAQLNWQTYCTR